MRARQANAGGLGGGRARPIWQRTVMPSGCPAPLRQHAGDWATAGVARRNLAEEQEMADAIAARWEDAVHATLLAERIAV